MSADGRVPARSPGASWQRVDGEMVVLDSEAGRLVGLNAVGAAAWELIDGARTVDQIARAIAERFHADPPQVAKDVAAFVAELQAAALIDFAK